MAQVVADLDLQILGVSGACAPSRELKITLNYHSTTSTSKHTQDVNSGRTRALLSKSCSMGWDPAQLILHSGCSQSLQQVGLGGNPSH